MAAVGVTNTEIRFRLGERRLTLRFRKVPFSAWAELKRTLGFTQQTVLKGIAELDVEAVAALIWLERKQRERKLNLVEVINSMDSDGDEDAPEFQILAMMIDGKSVIIDRDEADADDGDEPDPTKGS